MKNIGKKFFEFTKHKYSEEESDQQKGLSCPPIDATYDESAQLIDLPDFSDVSTKVDFQEIVNNRKSIRKYSDKVVTLVELSYLLWNTQGVKRVIKRENNAVSIRTVPSAGARHPFETLLLVNNVEGLESGLYRYIATKHKLINLNASTDIKEKVIEASYKQKFIGNSAVTFIWYADVYKTVWKYQERSYRYLLLDAGHVCQNLYLSAGTIDSTVCAIAAYNDDAMNNVLGLDGENQFVIYLATVGKRYK